MITIYRKSDGKPCTCDIDQLEAMTGGDKAQYTTKKPKPKKAEAEVDDTGGEGSGEGADVKTESPAPAGKKARKKK